MKTPAQILNEISVRKRRAKAAERQKRVRELKNQGCTAHQIRDILASEGLNVAHSTIYQDFSKIKREAEERKAKEKAAEKLKRVLATVRVHRNHGLDVIQIIDILNSQGFNIDHELVYHNFERLKREIEKSINAKTNANP